MKSNVREWFRINLLLYDDAGTKSYDGGFDVEKCNVLKRSSNVAHYCGFNFRWLKPLVQPPIMLEGAQIQQIITVNPQHNHFL